MGAGKSTVGKELSKILDREFIDLDELIVDSSGKSISDLFELYGEFYFRKIERKFLKKSLLKDNCIIATGGGASCYYNNIELINSNSTSIYLKVPLNDLSNRLIIEKNNRPLIKSLEESKVKAFVQSQLESRNKYYYACKHIITNTTIDSTIEKITKVMDERG